MKGRKQCPKCQSLNVGYLENILDETGDGGEKSRKIGKIFEKLLAFTVKTSVGETEAYVCTDCGYYETYIKGAATIPWNNMVGFRWCNERRPRRLVA